MSLKWVSLIAWGFFLVALQSVGALGQDVRIENEGISQDGHFTVTVSGVEDSYYVLRRGISVTNIYQAVGVRLGANGIVELADFNFLAGETTIFYRIQKILRAQSIDLDDDGIPDVYELERPSILNPLDRADADLDPDGDGRTFRDEFIANSTPLTTILQSSPANDEGGVSVTRKTVVRFSNPLGTDSSISGASFYAMFGGRPLLTIAELGADRRSATLFYQEPMPGGARIEVTFDGAGLKDYLGRQVDADGDGLPGGKAIIKFDTANNAPIDKTAVIGRIFAAELEPGATNMAAAKEHPLAGVRITVDGKEDTLFTVTDANGSFTLSPAPSGRFFVHIDGTTSPESNWPNGAYYPVLGKAWEAIPGRDDNLAAGTGTIYLPLVAAKTLQPLSPTTNTTITFPPEVIEKNPSLQGVSITVPANSLYDETGKRGGMVGIAPVPSNRLPEPLPPGLKHSIDISIQTDGGNVFDQPVPVRFPNLPDPETGEKLPPGAKSALWSFNHDTGRWEIQGPMTVTDDGNFVETDRGVGVKQPGWHGTMPGSTAQSDPPIPNRSCDEILNILGKDYASKKGTGDAGLAHQILCIAEGACANESTWAKGFIKRVFQREANDRESGIKNTVCPFEVPPWWFEIGPELTQLTIGDLCTMAGGAAHFRDELFPGFASESCETLIRERNNHNTFLFGTVAPCFLGQVVDGEMSPLGATVSAIGAVTGAFLLREGLIYNCQHGPFRASAIDTNQITANSFYSSELAAAYQFELVSDSFFIEPLKGFQLRRRDNQPLSQETKWFVVSDKKVAHIEQNGLLVLGPSPEPFIWSPYIVYVFALDNGKLGVGQFAMMDRDSDGDGIGDSFEIQHGMNPFVPNTTETDLDSDGLDDITELLYGTNPASADSDLDGYSDLLEVQAGSDPKNPGSMPKRGSMPPGRLYYRLFRVNDGTILRGEVANNRALQLVLAPGSEYILSEVDRASLMFGQIRFKSAPNGRNTVLPGIPLEKSTGTDTDRDGVSDEIELIVGTDPNNADTDGDGIPDGVEIQQGTDPLSNLAVRTGLIASAPTPGIAVDISTLNGLALVADSVAGISVFNVFNGLTPTLISQVDTPGDAQRVAASASFAAVADSSAGMAIIDISQPAASRLVRQVPVGVGDAVNAVAVQADLAYAGLKSGRLLQVDMARGAILSETNLPFAIRDVSIQGGIVAALGDSKVILMEAPAGGESFQQVGSINDGGLRISVAGNLAYITIPSGFTVLDIGNPAAIKVLSRSPGGQRGWQMSVPNGSGLGIAAAGVNGPEDVYVYDLKNPADASMFLAKLDTPGEARAVSIYNGIAYVADGSAGLSVINYLAYDNKKIPPTVALAADFSLNPPEVEEGKLVTLTANVFDDVQVRSVEFYVDGALMLTDGNYPFQFSFVTPTKSVSKTNFTVRARAVDTGGNSSSSPEITVALVADATPPKIKKLSPADKSISGSAPGIYAYFSEPIDASLLSSTNFQVLYAGVDSRIGTADDTFVPGKLAFQNTINAAIFTPDNSFSYGAYRITISSNITDLAGHHLTNNVQWTFWILASGSDGDDDRDGLSNAEEVALGTDPTNPDTDGDGWIDSLEVAESPDKSDPLNPNSHPSFAIYAAPPIALMIPASLENIAVAVARPGIAILRQSGEGLDSFQAEVIASPPVSLFLPQTENAQGAFPGVFVANPGVSVFLNGTDPLMNFFSGATIASPPVGVFLPAVDSSGNFIQASAIANPPVAVLRSELGTLNSISPSTTVANPPVKIRIEKP